jgi:drug/metabolite transporter (DMT)-like permease
MRRTRADNAGKQGQTRAQTAVLPPIGVRKKNVMSYLLIGSTIVLTVLGQLAVKGGMLQVGALPGRLEEVGGFLLRALTNPLVLGGLLLAVLAALSWMAAVSVSDISFAYPFMALAIVLVLALSGLLFGESVPVTRWVGVAVVCAGLVIAARG